MGDSFIGDDIEEGEATRAFSFPVTASDIALRPIPLLALETELLIWSDSWGDAPLSEDGSPSIRGDGDVRVAGLPFESDSRLVTVGDGVSFGEAVPGDLALALRNRPLKALL